MRYGMVGRRGHRLTFERFVRMSITYYLKQSAICINDSLITISYESRFCSGAMCILAKHCLYC